MIANESLGQILDVGVSLLPVFVFLAGLMFFDSFKLVQLRSVVWAILVGCFVAVAAFLINTEVVRQLNIDPVLYRRYGAPVLEEIGKAFYLFYLLRSDRIGFSVDAAIYGFAVGAGFAFVENIYYLQSLQDASFLVWFIRGFGTAIMHGGATAIVGILSKALSDKTSSRSFRILLPGLAIAVVVHSLYNHFLLSPLASTVGILVILPLLTVLVYERSEQVTRRWLGVGFDSDMELLNTITTGNIERTNVGRYLQSLQHRFRGEAIADMLCFLRVHLELSVQAKGILMMRASGFEVSPDPEVRSQLSELEYLERMIGRTGVLAMKPFFHTSNRHLWQLHMLGKEG
jgi:RsiW-degrading membrane proteinase PrsW (M82 family)